MGSKLCSSRQQKETYQGRVRYYGTVRSSWVRVYLNSLFLLRPFLLPPKNWVPVIEVVGKFSCIDVMVVVIGKIE